MILELVLRLFLIEYGRILKVHFGLDIPLLVDGERAANQTEVDLNLEDIKTNGQLTANRS